jgi:PAT family acetyl-CoA transporter-like MFS transporter 1
MKRRLSKDSAVSNESNNNFHPQPVDRSSTTGNSSPLWQDRYSIFLLLVLYLLQGVPMGLCGSIPLILKEKGVSYESLSLFSLVTIPFSMKILWAPFVDSYYIAKFGRRKSWLIPVQIVCGIMMILGSSSVKVWMREEDERANPHELSIGSLTGYFFTLYFLMATQDIAVDGWALTMLSRENVGYASTCNTIGQALGFFLANQAFIALSDQRWCHRFLGASSSLVSLSTFMTFWGIVFIAVTVVVWLFKKESLIEEKCDGIIETCQQIVSIGKLSPIRTLAWILLTCKIAFAPSDAVLSFKLQVFVF